MDLPYKGRETELDGFAEGLTGFLPVGPPALILGDVSQPVAGVQEVFFQTRLR